LSSPIDYNKEGLPTITPPMSSNQGNSQKRVVRTGYVRTVRSTTSGGGGTSRSNSNEPTLISGWEHTMYAPPFKNNDCQYHVNRYHYLGKDEETGEPEWLDYGPKGGRK